MVPRVLTVSPIHARDGLIHSFKLTVGLFLALFSLGALIENSDMLWVTVARIHVVVLSVFALSGVIAATIAYWNKGLPLTWLLVFACVSAWIWHVVPRDGTPTLTGATWSDIVLYAGIVAFIVGTVGYLCGRTAHHFDPT